MRDVIGGVFSFADFFADRFAVGLGCSEDFAEELRTDHKVAGELGKKIEEGCIARCDAQAHG